MPMPNLENIPIREMRDGDVAVLKRWGSTELTPPHEFHGWIVQRVRNELTRIGGGEGDRWGNIFGDLTEHWENTAVQLIFRSGSPLTGAPSGGARRRYSEFPDGMLYQAVNGRGSWVCFNHRTRPYLVGFSSGAADSWFTGDAAREDFQMYLVGETVWSSVTLEEEE